VLPDTFIFIDKGCVTKGDESPFAKDAEITNALEHLVFPFPGFVSRLDSAAPTLKFTPLVRTGRTGGTIQYSDIMRPSMFGMGSELDPEGAPHKHRDSQFVLAAWIQGDVPAERLMADEDPHGGFDPSMLGGLGGLGGKPAPAPAPKVVAGPGKVNVILVSDIDFLHSVFFDMRERGNLSETDIPFDFDNVTFVLNILDDLAGEDRFVAIRNRRPGHRTILTIDDKMKQAQNDNDDAILKMTEKFKADIEKAEKVRDDELRRLEEEYQKTGVNWNRQIEQSRERNKQQLEQEKKRIDTELAKKIRQVQHGYLASALFLPPILPLCLAVVMFVWRRAREREGVPRSRLRQ
jgi:ABC-2 type transport system permease protein